MSSNAIILKIDQMIRILCCILLFFIPYSKAIVETAVVGSCLLWMIKHAFIFRDYRSRKNAGNIFKDIIKAFSPANSIINQGIALFLLFAALSILGSVLPAQSLKGFFTKTIEGFAVCLIVIEVFKTRQHIRLAINVFIVTAFVVGLDTLVQYYWTGEDLFRQRILVEGYRATGGFLHPNLLGAFLTVAIPITMSCLISYESKKNRILKCLFFAFTSIVLLWALFLTYSRGAWMGTVLGVIFFALVILRRQMNPWLRRLVIVMVLVGGALFVFQIFELKKQVNTVKNDVETVSWRVALWRESLFLIKERPFLGHGVNTFMPVMTSRLKELNNPLAVGFTGSYAHNCYLQMAVEVGVLGLGAFLAILFTLFTRLLNCLSSAWDAKYLTVGILAGLLAFLGHATVDINFYAAELVVLFWLVAGLVISFGQQLSEKTTCVIK